MITIRPHTANNSIFGIRIFAFATLVLLTACGSGGSDTELEAEIEPPEFATLETLGESLYEDVNLSLDRTQSCATCHNTEHAFIDDREDDSGDILTVSEGDDEFSLGTRNTPTAAYAAFSPDFHEGTKARFNSQQDDYEGFLGGQFLDGRALNLEEQAEGPFLNEVEMMMPDEESVVERVMEDADYIESFKYLFGDNIFDDSELAFTAVAESIAAFERTDSFATFDSKYDLFLRGEFDEYILSKAAVGKALFFSQTDTNCATCHQLEANANSEETFSSYEYHNIGVPSNVALINTKESLGQTQAIDNGLYDNTEAEEDRGKFKVPTLRNAAVTAPYMHNGVFRNLETVMLFYDKYNNPDNTINPETGSVWLEPEVVDNLNATELEDGDIMTDDDVEALVCFLVSLTDANFEHLIEDEMNSCGL